MCQKRPSIGVKETYYGVADAVLKLARCVKRDPSLVVKLTYYCVTDAALKLGRSACCSEVVGVFLPLY